MITHSQHHQRGRITRCKPIDEHDSGGPASHKAMMTTSRIMVDDDGYDYDCASPATYNGIVLPAVTPPLLARRGRRIHGCFIFSRMSTNAQIIKARSCFHCAQFYLAESITRFTFSPTFVRIYTYVYTHKSQLM